MCKRSVTAVNICYSQVLMQHNFVHNTSHFMSSLSVSHSHFLQFALGRQISTMELVGKMLRYVWPKGNWYIRRLCIYAMMLLILAKVRLRTRFNIFHERAQLLQKIEFLTISCRTI